MGKGRPLLILHGFLGMGDNWKTLGKKISKEGFEVHLIDQRNHGRSPHSTAFDYEIMARDVLEYCQNHKLETIVLMGHSMGGKTAMFFATEYPKMVEKLIVVDIATKYYAPHHQTILKGLAYLASKKLTSRELADEYLSDFVSELAVRQFLLKNLYWKNKEELGLRMNLNVLIENIEAVSEALPDARVFSKEALFVKGEKSGYLKESDMEQIEKHFPNFNLVTIDGAGHWVHAEKQKEFFDEVMRFV